MNIKIWEIKKEKLQKEGYLKKEKKNSWLGSAHNESFL
jgi:hypothetical protein